MDFNLPFQSFTFNTTASGGEFHAWTEWRVAEPGDNKAMGHGEVQNINGTTPLVAFCIQTANDVRSPDTHIAVITPVSTNGVKDPDATPFTIDLTGKKFIRAGCSGKVGSGTGWVRMGGRVRTFKS